ncbi:MAG TPA: hypothetical protein VN761_02805 [Candidatus Polarisedimenticolia bacterium]|nr:hypothetical protein [Candidatus Polarisedimenticolia bacterium]
MKRFVPSFLLMTLLALVVVGASGCASQESDNASVRPWDAPQGWENGIPTGMYQNR